MEKKFHLVNGEPKPCNASIRDCPIGGEHYSTEAEARASYESNSEKSLFKNFNKKDNKEPKERRSIGEFIGNKMDKAIGDDPSFAREAAVVTGVGAGIVLLLTAAIATPFIIAGNINHNNTVQDYNKTPYSVSATVKHRGYDQDFIGTVKGSNLQDSHFDHCTRNLPKGGYVTCKTTDGKFTITAKSENHRHKTHRWTELERMHIKDNSNGRTYNLKLHDDGRDTNYYIPAGGITK